MSRPDLKGILSAVSTPLTDDGSAIDRQRLARLLEFQVAGRVHGVVVSGTTGEHSTLTVTERLALFDASAEAIHGRTALIAQVGATRTADVLELTRRARALKVTAVMVVPPYYDRLRWIDLRRFLDQVAEAAGQPLIYYHTPRVTGLDLNEDQLRELAEAGAIAYIKDSAADMVRTVKTMALRGAPTVLTGSDPLMFAGLCHGAPGSILGASTFIPELCVALYEAIHEKQDLNAARGIWTRLWPILGHLLATGYVAGAKAGCRLRGIDVGPPRLPLTPATPTDESRLEELMRAAGVP